MDGFYLHTSLFSHSTGQAVGVMIVVVVVGGGGASLFSHSTGQAVGVMIVVVVGGGPYTRLPRQCVIRRLVVCSKKPTACCEGQRTSK